MSVRITGITVDVADAVRDLRRYTERLKPKCDRLRERIAELVSNRAQSVFNSSVADSRFKVIDGGAVDDTRFGSVTVTVENEGENVTVIVADGRDAVFMEFGAGVYYNGAVGSSPNPWGTELGFTIGSYGKGYGKQEVWGYVGEDGEVHLTHGAPASMPLYRAVQSVSRDIVKIAREVFST